MHTLFHRILAPLLAVAAFVSAQDEGLPVLSASATDDLKAKEGQKVIVYGESARSGKSQSGINFVNFKEAQFTLVTFKNELKHFKDGEPADVYEGKRLAVTGVISVYNKKPQIKLSDPAQVRVLAEGEPWPGPSEKTKL